MHTNSEKPHVSRWLNERPDEEHWNSASRSKSLANTNGGGAANVDSLEKDMKEYQRGGVVRRR